MQTWFWIMLALSVPAWCRGDVNVWSPARGGSTSTNSLETNTLFPFLMKQAGLTNVPSMRYQQVYDSALFANLDRTTYVEQISFFLECLNAPFPGVFVEWNVPNMQINLSTTTKSAGTLSPVFSENVGPDDQIVFGPGANTFAATTPDGYLDVQLERSFRYDPGRGNLLLEVRIIDGSGPFDMDQPALEAFNTLSDGVSRIWSTNAEATVAEGADSTGLSTLFRFSPSSFLTVPAPRGAEIWTDFPFLIKQTYPQFYPSNVPVSIHYQQVYSSSLFTNLDPSLIYITSLTFVLESPNTNNLFGWSIMNMQVSLSTTTNTVGSLSPVFNDNVGSDQVIGVQPVGTTQFLASTPDGLLPVYLTTPFRYNPALGNLLLDVRLSHMSGPGYSDPRFPYLEAFNTPSNLVSRTWSTNVTASAANGMDGTGLTTIFQFSPTPSLQAQFRAFICNGCPTNVIQISWPSQPSVFQLQHADRLGANTVWRSVTNQIFGDAVGDGWSIWVPLTSAGAQGFYRLAWPNGQ